MRHILRSVTELGGTVGAAAVAVAVVWRAAAAGPGTAARQIEITDRTPGHAMRPSGARHAVEARMARHRHGRVRRSFEDAVLFEGR